MKRITVIAIALAFIGYAALGINTLVAKQQQLELKEVKLRSTTSDLKDLQLQYDQLNSKLNTELHKNTTDDQKVKQLESEKQDLQKQKDDLEAQLQARLQQKAADKARADQLATRALNAVTGTGTAAAASPADADKAFIYSHESGNVPCKINGGAIDCNYSGSLACGIGQALPCSKLTAVCSLADYACQDAFFTGYMQNRYGTWANARAFWEAHRWW